MGIGYRLRTNVTVILLNYCVHDIPQSLYIASFSTCRDLLFAFSSNLLPLMTMYAFSPLNAELNPICYLLALLGAHHILHISRIRVNVDSASEVGSVFLGYISYRSNKFSGIIMCYCA